MRDKLSISLLGALLGLVSVASNAILPETSVEVRNSSTTDNQVYAGLTWSWGNKQGVKLDFLVGFRSLHVESNDSVQGGSANLSIKYDQGLVLDDARLVYVDGKRNFMGNYGVGFSFLNKGVFATVAGQGSYYRFGGDYNFNNHNTKPYLEMNTLEEPDHEESKVTEHVYYN